MENHYEGGKHNREQRAAKPSKSTSKQRLCKENSQQFGDFCA